MKDGKNNTILFLTHINNNIEITINPKEILRIKWFEIIFENI